jgi:predicted DNA-binding transcriptional regulator YafY
MTTGQPAGLQLTEEEAFALLAMCLTSPHSLDSTAEKALRKLAEYSLAYSNNTDSHTIDLGKYTALNSLRTAEK